MALVTRFFSGQVCLFLVSADFPVRFCFFTVTRIVHNKRKIPFISCLLSSRAENIYFISTTKKRYKKVNPECNIARAIKSGRTKEGG